jgi:2-phospho-L-lactate guanylyltransferase
MGDVWALVPVKAPQQAKSRLLSVLQPSECAMLSRSMFMDVLAALDEAKSISKIGVLTNDNDVAALARQLGHHVIEDEAAGKLCDGLDSAARYIAAQDATSVLVLPGDIPTITAADIDELIGRHTAELSVCPAIRDGGTNALVCTPPDAVAFKFGNNSAQRHIEAAEQAGLKVERLAVSAFFRDIDLPTDLAWLLTQTTADNTIRFLRQSGIAARLNTIMLSASA